MFDRFTESARDAVARATTEAEVRGADRVRLEHLLLSLVRNDPGRKIDTLARKVLLNLGITRRAVEKAIGYRHIEDATVSAGHIGLAAPTFSPEARGAFAEATRFALSHGANYVGAEHLLAALATPLTRVFAELGTDTSAVLAAIGSELGATGVEKKQFDDFPVPLAPVLAWWMNADQQAAVKELADRYLLLSETEEAIVQQWAALERLGVRYDDREGQWLPTKTPPR